MKTRYILFDVDGTLTPSGGEILPEMVTCLQQLKTTTNCVLGLVGGGTYVKIQSQMGDALDLFDLVFAECGSVLYEKGNLVYSRNMMEVVNKEKLDRIIELAKDKIFAMPIVRTPDTPRNQIDVRQGLVYVSLPGMLASPIQRNHVKQVDAKLNLRRNLIKQLKQLDEEDELDIVIGGEVGIAIFPRGFDKSQVLKHFDMGTSEIYFFGDRTQSGENDYPLFSHPRVVGFSVKDWEDTCEKIRQNFV